VTPNDRHEGRDVATLAARRNVYAKARTAHAPALDGAYAQLVTHYCRALES
jgi:hypothetical protein